MLSQSKECRLFLNDALRNGDGQSRQEQKIITSPGTSQRKRRSYPDEAEQYGGEQQRVGGCNYCPSSIIGSECSQRRQCTRHAADVLDSLEQTLVGLRQRRNRCDFEEMFKLICNGTMQLHKTFQTQSETPRASRKERTQALPLRHFCSRPQRRFCIVRLIAWEHFGWWTVGFGFGRRRPRLE